MKIRFQLPNPFKILSPHPRIGGLEINDTDLRYLETRGKNPVQASERLPAGIIENGAIKDVLNFKKSLVSLHRQITARKKKKIAVILNIPDFNTYTQIFNLPFVASANIDEAAKMNLQMISPIDFATAYSSWQKVGESETEGGQFEILGAFTPKTIIDAFTKALEEASFSVVAIEFPSLALSRLMGAAEAKPGVNIILCRLSSSGMSFSVVHKKNLYFTYANAWEASKMFLTEFEDLIVREMQKVLNFYVSHWQSTPYDFAMMVPTPDLEQRITDIVKKNFSIEPKPFKTILAADIAKMNLSTLTEDWFPALGSALRGTISRSKDDIVSLASVGTKERFNREQLLGFIHLWRNIVFASLFIVVLLFTGINQFLNQTAISLSNKLDQIKVSSPSSQELTDLTDQANKFNGAVSLVAEIRQQKADLLAQIVKIQNVASTTIGIQHIAIQGENLPVLFVGQAPNQDAILKFKDALSHDPSFSEIDLPLSTISTGPGGVVNFNMTFKVNSQ